MKIKFLYNTLLSVGMALVFLSAVSSIQQEQYTFLIISILMFVILVWLKIKVLKDVRQSIRSKK